MKSFAPFSRQIGLRLRYEDDILIIRGPNGECHRRVLYVNSYGMAKAFRLWDKGVYPGHHLWGCLELALQGYEVLIPEPTKTTGLRKRFANDLKAAKIAFSHLSSNDVVYCGHNVLFWVPLLKAVKAIGCKVVGLLFAGEPLPFAAAYDGIVAHTPVAQTHAESLAPRTPCRHISWGIDLRFFHHYPYQPRFALSCGKTFRDFEVISQAWLKLSLPLTIVHPDPRSLHRMPEAVTLVSASGLGQEIYVPLIEEYYRYASVSLLTLMPDCSSRHAIGITNLFESMASGRPVIVSRTSALTSEIDIELAGVGMYVDPSDADSLRKAVLWLHSHPAEASEMGARGRQLCENHYNMRRFGHDLFSFLEEL